MFRLHIVALLALMMGSFALGGQDCGSGDTEPPVIGGLSDPWQQDRLITAPDVSASDNFGHTLDLSATHALIGAPRAGTVDGGAAYLYTRSGGQLTYTATLTAPDAAVGDDFGASVAIDGLWAMVGAPGKGRGAVYLYRNVGSDTWALVAKLEDYSLSIGDRYGASVAVENDRMIIGVPRPDNTIYSGGVRLYRWSASQSRLVDEGYFTAGDASVGDGFGSAVDISGTHFVVGAPERTESGQARAGAVYLFDNLQNYPDQAAKFMAATPRANGILGYSVAIDQDKAVGGGGGIAQVYGREAGTRNWTRRAELSGGGSFSNYFGNSVAIAGNRAIIGSGFEFNGAFGAGGAFVYDENIPDIWAQTTQLTHASPAAFDNLGSDVAISGQQVLVGAVFRDISGGADAGAAYLFTETGATSLPPVTLVSCGGPVTVDAPTAEDDCAGTVTGSTNTPTTFNTPGSYSLTWSFADGNGNVATAKQAVVVTAGDLSIDDVQITAADCDGTDGSIRVQASCTSCSGTIEYRVNGGAFGTASIFENLSPGLYEVEVRDGGSSSCSVQQQVLVPERQPAPPVVDNQSFTGWAASGQVGNPDSDSRQTIGQAIAMDGTYTIVGDSDNQKMGADAGAVFIYKRDATGQSTLTATLHATDIAPQDLFGYAVDISGNLAIVGSFNASTTKSNVGAAYIFQRQTDGSWTQQAKLIAGDGLDYAHFGEAVSIDGDRAIVGATGQGLTTTERRGAAYIFERQSDGNWIEVATLSRGADDIGGRLGYSVAISGDVAVVGNRNDPLGFTSAGSVYIYERAPTGSWQQTAKLRAADVSGYFGADVDISGQTILVGAPRDDEGDFSTGAAYVFVRNAEAGWSQQAKLRASNPSGGSEFGEAVALDGEYAVIGVRDENTVAQSRGAVYVFGRSADTENWTELVQIEPPTDAAFQFFGHDVAISEGYLVASAPNLYNSEPPASQLYWYTPERTLPNQTVVLCAGTATISPPTATDNCAGTITGTTTDPTSFDTPGDYTVNWTFDDGSGNLAMASQQITVIANDLQITDIIPLSENCPGSSDASLTISAVCTTCTGELEYSVDGSTYQSIPVLNGLSAGNITVYVRDASTPDCVTTQSVTITSGSDSSSPAVVNEYAGARWNRVAEANSVWSFNASFGAGFDVSGNEMVVGENGYITTGRIHRFIRQSDNSWSFSATLNPPTTEEVVRFGDNVVIDGDDMLINAPGRAPTSGWGAQPGVPGKIFAYRRQSGGGWTRTQTILPSVPQDGDYFGEDIEVVGNYALIGASRKTVSDQSSAGAAYLFKKGTDNVWRQTQRLLADGSQEYAFFGRGVAMNETFAAVTARGESVSGTTTMGYVYVYRRSSNGILQIHQKIPVSSQYGNSLELVDNHLLIGTLPAETGEGELQVYAYNADSDQWTHNGTVRRPVDPAGQTTQFGRNLAVAGDSLLVSGADKAAYLFVRSKSGDWTLRQQLRPEGELDYASLGFFGLHLGDGRAYVDADLSGGGESIVELDLTQVIVMPDTLTLCGGPAIAAAPTAVDNCAGTITGTTTDPISLASAGTYTVTWTFDDGNGNATQATQQITVTASNLTLTSAAQTPVSCPGGADGSIEITASCADCPAGIEYSIDGENYQDSPLFTGLTAGLYTYSVRDVDNPAGCTPSKQIALGTMVDQTAPAPTDSQPGWMEISKLVTDPTSFNANFGEAVAVYGSYGIVGAPGESNGSLNAAGAAYITERDQNGEWQITQRLTPADPSGGAGFGGSVAIHGDIALIGAPEDTEWGLFAGAVYVFALRNGSWQETQKLFPSIGGPFGRFGTRLAFDGNRAIIASPAETVNGQDAAGAAYVFDRGSDESWVFKDVLTAATPLANAQYGRAVTVSGDLIAIGDRWNNTLATTAGAVDVFRYTGSWQRTATLYSGQPEASGGFGIAVAIDGGTLVVGADGEGEGLLADAGAAYVFTTTDDGLNWSSPRRLLPSIRKGLAWFGSSVTIDGDRIVIGAPNEKDENDRFNNGAAYAFARQTDGSWLETSRLLPDFGEYFGTSVAINGSQILVGADAYLGYGAAFVYAERTLLPDARLSLCSGRATLPPPTATDNCTGTVTGTTTDPTTFTSPGEYTITWIFNDGNGNATTATQQVTVGDYTPDLPMAETVEADSPLRDCWDVTNGGAMGGWFVEIDGNLAHTGTTAFRLAGNPNATQDDRLTSPALPLTAGQTYRLRFHYRAVDAASGGRLRALLTDSEGTTTVKLLSADPAAPGSYVSTELLFEAPATADYRLTFLSLSPAGSQGLLLDDITLEAYAPPTTGGEALLAGSLDESCTSGNGYGVCGDAWTRIFNDDGKLIAEINPQGNDLGTVDVGLTDYVLPPLSPFSGNLLLSRYFGITPENGPGPYTENGGVRVRLFFADAELDQLADLTGSALDWSALAITHYSGTDTDCSLLNSSGGSYTTEAVRRVQDFGGSAQVLEFTTTDFSEFGAGQASALPVVLTDFTARAVGTVNRLDWSVASEIAFSHYAVERSTDGTAFSEFTRIAGTRAPAYTTEDPDPAPLTYYRLRMVDLDGSEAYSAVVSVRREDDQSSRTLSVFPVPTTGQLTLRFTAPDESPLTARITDPLGRTVRQFTLRPQAGTNTISLDVSVLSRATYQLTLSDGKNIQTVRFGRQ